MTSLLATAWLLIIAVLLAACPVSAAPGPSVPAARAFAPHRFAVAGERVQAPGAPSDSTTVLDINGSGKIHLHNRLLTGGLLIYMAVMVGALVFLQKRRVAAAVILGAGLIVGCLLLARAFG